MGATDKMNTTKAWEPADGNEFDGLVHLFTDEMTCCQYDRQISVLNQLLRKFPDGFYIRSALRGIPETIAACTDRLKDGKMEFMAPLIELLELSAIPFKYAKVADGLQHKQCVLNVLNGAADVLEIPNEKVRMQALATLQEVVSHVRAKDSDDLTLLRVQKEGAGDKPKGAQVVPGAKSTVTIMQYNNIESTRPDETVKYNKQSNLYQALKESSFVDTLLKELKTPDLSAEVQAAVCGALREVSYYAHCCRIMSNQGGLDRLMQLLEECDFRDHQVFVALEIVWNILELNPTARETVGSFHYVSVLHRLLHSALVHGYKLKDKEFRNDIVAVCTLVAEDPDNHQFFFKTGLTELLFIAAVGTEMGIEHEALKPFMQTISEEDFELKKLTWNILYILSFYRDNALLMRDAGMLQALFQYLDVECSTPEVVRWPTIQLLDLQHLSLNIVTQLAITGPHHFHEANGATILLTFLKECMDLSLRNSTLRSMVHLANSECRVAFIDANAIESMLELITVELDLNVKRDCFQIISDLCAGEGEDQDLAREQFYRNRGLELLLPYLDLDPKNTTAQHLLYAVVDCVWNAVLGSSTNEDRFLELKGVHKILDVVERSPDWIQICMLTCLVDFFQKPASVAQAQKWAHKVHKTPVEKLLIALWRNAGGGPMEPARAKQAADLQAQQKSIDTSGILFALADPSYRKAMSTAHLQPDVVLTLGAEDVPPGGSVDLLAQLVTSTDIKTKIYCLFAHIGLEGPDSLTYDEKNLLVEIRQYVEARKDRMWEFVEGTLKENRCQPTSPDRARLDKSNEMKVQRQNKLRGEQEQWREKEYAWLDEGERTFYQTLIKRSDDPEVANKRNATGLTITQAKIRKSEMLKASFQSAQHQQQEQIKAQTREMHESVHLNGEGSFGPGANMHAKQRKAPSSAPPRDRSPLGYSPTPSPVPPSAPSGDQINMSPLMFDALDQFVVLDGIDADIPPSVRAFADRTSAQLGGTEGQQFLSETEYGIFNSLKALRQEPASFVPKLEVLREKLVAEAEADGTKDPQLVREAYDQAIAALNLLVPGKAIKNIPIGMTLAARDLALSLGLKGLTTAEGVPTLTADTRLSRYGTLEGDPTDCICYARRSPDDIVCQMLGTPGLMDQLLDPNHRYVGVGVGWHRLAQYVCVVTLAPGYRDKPRTIQQTLHERFIQQTLGAGTEGRSGTASPESGRA